LTKCGFGDTLMKASNESSARPSGRDSTSEEPVNGGPEQGGSLRFSSALAMVRELVRSGPGAGELVLWGKRLCRLTRELHFECWRWRPSKDFVRSDVIPFLREAAEAIGKHGEPGETGGLYVRNITLRAANLEGRYLRDLPSAIDPEDPLDTPSPLPALTRGELEKLGVPAEDIALLLSG